MKRDFIPFIQMTPAEQREHLNRLHWVQARDLDWMRAENRESFHRADHAANVTFLPHTHYKRSAMRGFADPEGLAQD